MNQLDIKQELSFNNDQIKRAVNVETFTLPGLVDYVFLADTLVIEDNNIIPVHLRVSIQAPNALDGVGPIIPLGIFASYRVWFDNFASNVLLDVEASLSNIYAPVFTQTFFGSIRKPLTDFNIMEMQGVVKVVDNGTFAANLSGKITTEFYYIPIRY